MPDIRQRLRTAGCVVISILATSAAHAAEKAGFDVSANVGVVSDYRFRGISLSGRDPALQGGIDLAAPAGWYVGAWATTIEETAGADAEVDLYAGYGGTAAGLDYSVEALGYFYPGGQDLDYFELLASAGRQVGSAAVKLQVGYTPDQWNTSRDNLYVGVESSFTLGESPFGLLLRAGRENGFYDDKWDWEAGLTYGIGPLAASLSYVDSNYGGPDEAGWAGRGGLVGSVVLTF